MSKLKKGLKWLGMSLGVLLVAPLTVWIGWNSFDEALDARAVAYGAPQESKVADSENGYFAAIGMDAPVGTSTVAFGQAWVTERRATAREGRAQKLPEPRRASGQVQCNPLTSPCVKALLAKPDGIAGQLGAYSEDLERYEALLAYQRYEEVRDYDRGFDIEIPPVRNLREVQRAYLARVALTLLDGQGESAVIMLEREFAFHRLMLSGSHTLVPKLIARAMYATDLAFLADLLEHRAAELKPHAVRLGVQLAMLEPAALSMEEAIAAESRYVSQHDIMPGANPDSIKDSIVLRLLGLISKPNATHNLSYQLYSAMGNASRASAKDFSAERKKLPDPGELFQFRFWDFFDNPVGKLSLSFAISSLDRYVLEMHDLDAFNRLLALRVAVLASGVDELGIAAFVGQSDPRLHDPYSVKPMVWDPASRRLSVRVSEYATQRQLIYVDKGRAFVQL
jgi:hypothetical protein